MGHFIGNNSNFKTFSRSRSKQFCGSFYTMDKNRNYEGNQVTQPQVARPVSTLSQLTIANGNKLVLRLFCPLCKTTKIPYYSLNLVLDKNETFLFLVLNTVSNALCVVQRGQEQQQALQMHKTAFGMAWLLKKRVLSPNVFEQKDEEHSVLKSQEQSHL